MPYNLYSPVPGCIVQAGLVDQVGSIKLAALKYKPVDHGDCLVFILNQHGCEQRILSQSVVT